MDERKFPFEAARNVILPIIEGEVNERVRRISQILFGPRCFEIEEREFIPYRLSGLEHLKVTKQFYGRGIVDMLEDFQEEIRMAAKAKKTAKKGAKRVSHASLKRSTSRSRSRAGKAPRPTKRSAESVEQASQAIELKKLIPQQPIDGADREQAEGHGNQRALLTRAQAQAGQVSGAEGLMPKDELIGAINQLAPEAPRTLMTTFAQVTEGYAEILRYETEQYINRVRETLGSNV